MIDDMERLFGRIIVSDAISKDTLFLVPPVTLTHYLNIQTGEVKQYFEFDPEMSAVITSIKEDSQ